MPCGLQARAARLCSYLSNVGEIDHSPFALGLDGIHKAVDDGHNVGMVVPGVREVQILAEVASHVQTSSRDLPK